MDLQREHEPRPDSAFERTTKQAERQVICFLMSRDKKYLKHVFRPKDEDDLYKNVALIRPTCLDWIGRGLIKESDLNDIKKETDQNMKERLRSPDGDNTLKNLFRVLSISPEAKRFFAFLAVSTGKDARDRDTISAQDLKRFYEIYPTLGDFLGRGWSFLDSWIHKALSPQDQTYGTNKVGEYTKARIELTNLLYLGSFAYHAAIDQLLHESNEHAHIRKERNNRARKTSLPEVIREDVGEREGRLLVSSFEIRADPFNNGEKLDHAMIVRNGLSPRYRIQIKDTTIWYSVPYLGPQEHIAVVAYVQAQNPITGQVERVIRTHYLSRSQVFWRYIPARETEENAIVHLDKGYAQDSIQLPCLLQKELAGLIQKHPVIQIKDQILIFGGLAREKSGAPKYGVMQKQNSYHNIVERSPTSLPGFFEARDEQAMRGELAPPESIHFEQAESEPDFTKSPDITWNVENPVYGPVTVEGYVSRNGTYRFLMCTDTEGRAWVGNIEYTDEDIYSHGLPRRWVKAGDLTTPADEYIDERTAQYIGRVNPRYSDYGDVYHKYLSKIPLIKRYQSERRHQRDANKPLPNQIEKKSPLSPIKTSHLEDWRVNIIKAAGSPSDLFGRISWLASQGEHIPRSSGGLYAPEVVLAQVRAAFNQRDPRLAPSALGIRTKVIELLSIER